MCHTVGSNARAANQPGWVARRAPAGALHWRPARWLGCWRARPPDRDNDRGLLLTLVAHVWVAEGDLVAQVVDFVCPLHERVEPAERRVDRDETDRCGEAEAKSTLTTS
jgi:hypothetical protein